MTGIFKANNSYNNFALVVYGFALKLPFMFFAGELQPANGDGPLFFFIRNLLSGLPAFVTGLFAVLLSIFQAIYLNEWVNRQRLFTKPAHLVGMCYLLLTSIFAVWFTLSAVLLVNTLGILMLSQLTSLQSSPKAKTTLFNIGILVGIASGIFIPAIGLLILAWAGLALARPFKLTEWLMVLLGMLAPAYFYFSVMYLMGKPLFEQIHLNVPSVPLIAYTTYSIAAAVLLIIWLITGIYYAQQNMRRQVVTTRKTWRLIYGYGVVALCLALIMGKNVLPVAMLAMVPVAVIAASAQFYPRKNLVPLIFHLCALGLAIMAGYFL